jgi:multidrug transporter EmrE-like cation transporter
MNPYRDIWIGAGVAIAIMLVGAALFHNVPAVMQATALIGLIIGILVRHALDPNAPRRGERD